MSTYETGSDDYRLSDDQIECIKAFLNNMVGSFRLYAIDMNGNPIFLSDESCGMEIAAIESLMVTVEDGCYGKEMVITDFVEFEDCDEEDE